MNIEFCCEMLLICKFSILSSRCFFFYNIFLVIFKFKMLSVLKVELFTDFRNNLNYCTEEMKRPDK